MRWRAWRAGLVLLGAVCLGGCGGGGRDLPDPGPDAGIDPSTPLSSLTPAEFTQLCEWVAGRFGGYGHRITCSNGDYFSSASSCGNAMPISCPDQVGEVQSCVDEVIGGCTALPVDCVNLLLDCGMPMVNAHRSLREPARPPFEVGRGVTTAGATASDPAH